MKTLVHHLVESAVRSNDDATALVFGRQTVSYGALWSQMRCFATGLRQLALPRSGRVGIYLDKRIETIVSIFGTSVVAGAFVPINPVLRAQQVGYILRDCDVRVLVTSSDRLEALGDALGDCAELKTIVLVGGRGSEELDLPGVQLVDWETLTAAEDGNDARSVDSDLAAILYTSGSTGQPKGVVLSHRNLVAGAESVSHYLGNGPHDRILSLLPLSFDAGLSQLTTGFTSGAAVVLHNFLLARDVVRVCRKQAITGLTCVPPLYSKLVEEDWSGEAGEQVRYFANTGGHMARPLLERLRTAFPNARPYLMYGLTEAFRSTYLEPEEVDRRPDSIGRAIPNAEILVVRPDGSECEPEETGELVHRGPLVAMGYWNKPELTAERFRPSPRPPEGAAFPEMAVWSGDLVRRDEQGFLYFVGRNDDMIKTSGYRVSPTEVEEVVLQTGLVAEAAAFGVPDEELGQTIIVVVAPKDADAFDPAELIGECRRTLPMYMVPREVEVRASLPRNPNGKIDRPKLQGEWRERGEGDGRG